MKNNLIVLITFVLPIISLYSCSTVEKRAETRPEQSTEELAALKGENFQKEINQLLKELAEGDIIEQYQAGRKLKKIGSPAVPALINALKEDNKKLRKAAMIVLGEIKDERAVPILVDELEKTKDKKLRAGLIVILGRMGDKRATPLLMNALDENSDEIVGAAAYALGKLKEEKSVSSLMPLLNHPNEYVRKTVTEALGRIGEPAVSVLVQEIRNMPLNTQYLAIKILGSIGGTEAVNALLDALKDDNEYIRLSAAESLSKLGNKEGYALGLKNLNSLRPEYQTVAKKILENLGKKVEWDDGKKEYVVK